MANPIISLKVAQAYDIEVYEGDTTDMVLEFYDDDDLPFAVDDVEVKIRTKAGTLHDTFNVASGDVVISGTDSNIATISGWSTLADASYDYDLAIIYDTTKKVTFFEGETRVTADK